MTRDTRLLPGHQIWELTPGFAATFWTGFSFQKIFRERLFSGIADYRRDAYRPVCEEPASVDQVAHSTPPDLTPHRRDITPTRQEEMGCAAETRQGDPPANQRQITRAKPTTSAGKSLKSS